MSQCFVRHALAIMLACIICIGNGRTLGQESEARVLAMEVVQLRSEVKELRADIKRLTALLEAQVVSAISQYKQPAGLISNQALSAVQCRDLSLEECISITLENVLKPREPTSDTEIETKTHQQTLIKSVRDQYWDLWASYQVLAVTEEARNNALAFCRVVDSLDLKGSSGIATQARAQLDHLEAEVQGILMGSFSLGSDRRGLRARASALRLTLGLKNDDGPLLRPTDDPDNTPFQPSWHDTLQETLDGNLALHRVKKLIEQKELEFSSAREKVLPLLKNEEDLRWYGASKTVKSLFDGSDREVYPIGMRRNLIQIQNTSLQIEKAKLEYHETQMVLMKELSFAFRSLDSTYTTAHDYLDQVHAGDVEIALCKEKIAREIAGGNEDIHQLGDNLLRAQERSVRSKSLYHQAIGEYQKAITQIAFLKGALVVIAPSVNMPSK